MLLTLTPTIDLELELDLDLDLGLDLGLDFRYLNKLLDTEEMTILLKGYDLGSINYLSLSDSTFENSDIHFELLAIIKKLL